MLNRRTFNIDLDIIDIGKPPAIIGKVKQLDGTTINAVLRNNGKPMDLTDCIIRLFFKRPDGMSEFQKIDIEITSALEGSIKINCVDEIFELVGKVLFEVEVVDLDGYIETSPEFGIEVIDKIGDDTDREIIRVQEVSLMEELKDYVLQSTAQIETFKGLLNEITGDDYDTLLSQLIGVEDQMKLIIPAANSTLIELDSKIEAAKEIKITMETLDDELQSNEAVRESQEQIRVGTELIRLEAENSRQSSEAIRLDSESKRVEMELGREANEKLRQEAEGSRVASEENRRLKELERNEKVEELESSVVDLSVKIDDFSKDGNFNNDIVVKGNIYPTVDGVKPVHSGPPTKKAGNILMPYARAIGGFTKDGSGVRTIGFVAKPMDANPSLDITEEQNSDAVFLGTDVSQLYLYSKEKYPTVVSQNELSPIATQDWVMRLVEGLGLLDGVGDSTEAIFSSIPTELFDLEVSNSWATVAGDWILSDSTKTATLENGQANLYKPLIARPDINEVTFISEETNRPSTFVGLWSTENYIYGCRLKNNTLNISYFGKNGSRGGANTFTIRTPIEPGDTITLHYNFSNDIWEMYKFDANNEPILVYQMSKFMMSGFPEFYNGRTVNPAVSFLAEQGALVRILDCPNPAPIRNHEAHMDYIF